MLQWHISSNHKSIKNDLLIKMKCYLFLLLQKKKVSGKTTNMTVSLIEGLLCLSGSANMKLSQSLCLAA